MNKLNIAMLPWVYLIAAVISRRKTVIRRTAELASTPQNLQAIHAGLLSDFSQGVAIEETDIDDLKAAVSVTDNRDVLAVYGNLLNGSLNHLSAFNSHIEAVTSN